VVREGDEFQEVSRCKPKAVAFRRGYCIALLDHLLVVYSVSVLTDSII